MRIYLFIAVMVFSIFLSCGSAMAASDEENCMLCHKYPGLTRINDEGYQRVFYVDSDRFSHSVHERVKCRGCHTDITQIPHKAAKPVNCTTECHLKDSPTAKPFSHKRILDDLKTSIHNPQNQYVRNRDKADFPTCTNCHSNPVFRYGKSEDAAYRDKHKEDILKDCAVCHQDSNVDYKYFFEHVTHRVKRIMPSEDVVATCTKCHSNAEMAEKHKIKNAGATYEDTFHGKAVQFGLNNAPSCIDCHVKKGESAHKIMSYKSPQSATFEPNRYLTCKDSNCHKNPKQAFGDITMHVVIDRHMYPIEFYTAICFTILTAGVFYLLQVLMILELIRTMFPNFSLLRKKNRD